MTINPSRFAFYLKNSSLSSAEQRAVLTRLPDMNEADIKTLYNRLKADHEAMSKALKKAHLQRHDLEEKLKRDLKESSES